MWFLPLHPQHPKTFPLIQGNIHEVVQTTNEWMKEVIIQFSQYWQVFSSVTSEHCKRRFLSSGWKHPLSEKLPKVSIRRTYVQLCGIESQQRNPRRVWLRSLVEGIICHRLSAKGDVSPDGGGTDNWIAILKFSKTKHTEKDTGTGNPTVGVLQSHSSLGWLELGRAKLRAQSS